MKITRKPTNGRKKPLSLENRATGKHHIRDKWWHKGRSGET